MKTITLPVILILYVTGIPAFAENQKSLADYFLPMEPQGPLVSEEIWGNPTVLPRDIKKGETRIFRYVEWPNRGVSVDKLKWVEQQK